MSAAHIEWPTPEAECDLHRRLLEGDPVATADIALAFLGPLIHWLHCRNRISDDHVYQQAAADAIIALLKNPRSYQPASGKSLNAYLQMSASGDLKNILNSEQRRTTGRNSLEAVELSPDAGKYLGSEDDPSRILELSDEVEFVNETILATVRIGLMAEELAGLDLYLTGETETKAFAAALKIGPLPDGEDESVVKRFKDKMKARIKRARRDHADRS